MTLALILPLAVASAAVAQAADRAQALKDSIGLVRAIEIAEASGGGHALEAELKQHGMGFVIAVEVAGQTDLTEMRLDARSGSVLSSKSEKTAAIREADEVAELTALRAAKLDLKGAVRIAEKESHGRALEAGLESDGNGARYEIKVLVGDDASIVTVDPMTSRVLSLGKAGDKDDDDHDADNDNDNDGDEDGDNDNR